MDFVFLGRQGSGKGTQVQKFLTAHPEYTKFEMGGAFRNLLKTDTPLAHEIQKVYDNGVLASDEQVMRVFTDAMEKYETLPAHMTFDGIPRKVGQKGMFDEWMKEQGRDFRVINIKISRDEAVSRLTQRRICEDCGKAFMPDYTAETCDVCGGKLITRRDETPESIQKRLDEFEKFTVAVLEAYDQEGILIDINGEQMPDAVFAEIMEKVTPLL